MHGGEQGDDGLGRPGAAVRGLADAAGGQLRLSARVLAIALGLSLWIASASLVLAILDGLGGNPVRRLLVGLALVLAMVAALWRRGAVCAALRARPWLVVPIAAGVMAVVSVDGITEDGHMGPLFAITVTPLGLAAVVAGPRLVWCCVALLEVCLLAAATVEGALPGSPGSLLGAILGYPFAALVVLGLATLFGRFVANADTIVESIRRGAPMLTPALATAVALEAGRPIALLEPPSPFAELTPSERRVVAGLARGARPKQLAQEWRVSLATIRKHIANAKRKTGARTLPELAAMTARPDWPADADDRGGSVPQAAP